MGPMDGPIGTGTEAPYFETSARPKLLYIETEITDKKVESFSNPASKLHQIDFLDMAKKVKKNPKLVLNVNSVGRIASFS